MKPTNLRVPAVSYFCVSAIGRISDILETTFCKRTISPKGISPDTQLPGGALLFQLGLTAWPMHATVF